MPQRPKQPRLFQTSSAVDQLVFEKTTREPDALSKVRDTLVEFSPTAAVQSTLQLESSDALRLPKHKLESSRQEIDGSIRRALKIFSERKHGHLREKEKAMMQLFSRIEQLKKAIDERSGRAIRA